MLQNNSSPYQAVMITMGFIFAVLGIILYVKQFGKNEENEVKILNWSLKLSNSAILIFIVGVALVMVGYINPNPNTTHNGKITEGVVSTADTAVDYREFCNRVLTPADLKGKSPSELALIRNTIFAMHGYIFHVNPVIIDYFNKQSWYHPRSDFNFNSDLSERERKNVELIESFEKKFQ